MLLVVVILKINEYWKGFVVGGVVSAVEKKIEIRSRNCLDDYKVGVKSMWRIIKLVLINVEDFKIGTYDEISLCNYYLKGTQN